MEAGEGGVYMLRIMRKRKLSDVCIFGSRAW